MRVKLNDITALNELILPVFVFLGLFAKLAVIYIVSSAPNAVMLQIEQTPANGVYLYTVTVQTSDGATRRELRKLVVAR